MPPDDVFGPYVAPSAPSASAPRTSEPFVHAAVAGAVGGALTAVLGGVPYWVAYGQTDVELAWGEVGVVFFVFVVVTGAVACLAIRGGVSLADRYLGGGPIRSAAAALVGAAVFGTIGGVLPGSFGTAYLGSQHAPFMGTAMLALAPLPGALLASTSMALVDRRSVGIEARTALTLGLALLATLAFACLGAAVCAAVDDDTMLDAFRAGSAQLSAEGTGPEGLARVGAIAGAILGLFVGSHIGVTIALSRLVFGSRRAGRLD